MDLMGHGIKSSLDFLYEIKSSLDFILLSQCRLSIGTAVCKWMDETACRFAFLRDKSLFVLKLQVFLKLASFFLVCKFVFSLQVCL